MSRVDILWEGGAEKTDRSPPLTLVWRSSLSALSLASCTIRFHTPPPWPWLFFAFVSHPPAPSLPSFSRPVVARNRAPLSSTLKMTPSSSVSTPPLSAPRSKDFVLICSPLSSTTLSSRTTLLSRRSIISSLQNRAAAESSPASIDAMVKSSAPCVVLHTWIPVFSIDFRNEVVQVWEVRSCGLS